MAFASGSLSSGWRFGVGVERFPLPNPSAVGWAGWLLFLSICGLGGACLVVWLSGMALLYKLIGVFW